MKRSLGIGLFTGITALVIAAGAQAQTGRNFVDEDGDGICDNVALNRANRPNCTGLGLGPRLGLGRLTTDQRTEIRALVSTMKTDGKTREEVRAAVSAKYTEWGVTAMGRSGRGMRGQGRHGARIHVTN